MKITEEMVDYISALARLKLPQAEKTRMTGELEPVSYTHLDVYKRQVPVHDPGSL